MATDLDQLERTDEDKTRLEHLITEHPKDTEAILAFGNILRGRKDFAACADVYSKAIATIVPKPEKIELGDVLFPRYLLRALATVAECGSRPEKGARALSPTNRSSSITSAIPGSAKGVHMDGQRA